jgi:hypothetical protein
MAYDMPDSSPFIVSLEDTPTELQREAFKAALVYAASRCFSMRGIISPAASDPPTIPRLS